jgi:hypothetical protein
MSRSLVLVLALAACTPDALLVPQQPPVSATPSEPFTRLDSGVWRAVRGNLLLDLDATGAHLRRDDAAVTVRFDAWGRPGAERIAQEVEPTPCASPCEDRLELVRDDSVEWWSRRGVQVEQGWDLQTRPSGEEPLILRLTVEGDAAPVVTPERVTLGTWSITEPHAWDAEGRALPTWFEAEGADVLVRVDDRDAVWPITVDPLYGPTRRTLLTAAHTGRFGLSVEGGGDINGDGYDDVLVGDDSVDANPANGTSARDGLVHVYFGGTLGPAIMPATTLIGALGGDDRMGACMAIADVNNDGYDDVVGVESSNQIGEGLRVFHGGPGTTLDATPDALTEAGYSGSCAAERLNANGDAYDDVAVRNQADTWVYHGSASGLVTTAGTYLNVPTGGGMAALDHDGDGYDDLLIGRPDQGVGSTGVVHVYAGSAAGVATSSTLSLSLPGTVDFGTGIGNAGDVNGDGHEDLIVGDAGLPGAFLYHGHPSGLGSATAVRLTLSPAIGGAGWVVGDAGDMNGDGYDDVFTGTGDADPAGVAIYRGGATGISLTADPTDGAPGCKYDASAAGDVDNDGQDDLICGNFYGNEAWIAYGCPDVDADGWCDDIDCDDNDAAVHPNAVEVAGDEVDQDCDGAELCFDDADNDNFLDTSGRTRPSTDLSCAGSREGSASTPTTDCDDGDAAISPSATEMPGDEVDQDCDGTELCFDDDDNDGFRDTSGDTSASPDLSCAQAFEGSLSTPTTDCDDGNDAIHPNATEIPDDGVDQDCDGLEDCYVDADGDGLRANTVTTSASLDCAEIGVASADAPEDCDDTSIDADADGLDDSEEVLQLSTDPCEQDSDNDGLGDGEEAQDFGTDPNLPDTDGGGLGDGEELAQGTDPLDPSDDDVVKGEGGCGCRSGSPVQPGVLVLLLALGVRRRRAGR